MTYLYTYLHQCHEYKYALVLKEKKSSHNNAFESSLTVALTYTVNVSLAFEYVTAKLVQELLIKTLLVETVCIAPESLYETKLEMKK